MRISFSSTRRPEASAVLRLYQFAPWAWKRTKGGVVRAMQATPLFFSAWDGAKLVGMGRAGTDFTFRAVLWDLIVDPEYAKRGIGSRLVQCFLKHPRLKTVESFWLFTTDKQAFYKKLGFSLNTENVMIKRR